MAELTAVRSARLGRTALLERWRHLPRVDAAALRFEEARRQVLPFAEAHGYLTDDGVFRDVT